jgi:hypothetical protein
MGKAICIRCNWPIGVDDGLAIANICQSCLDALPSSTNADISSFLESLEHPAAFISHGLSVRISNDLLGKMVNRLTDDLLGVRIGEALECAYESEHGNCGETHICLQCGVRRMVDLARITGERFHDIPLALRSKAGSEHKLLFTFAKAGDAILVLLKSLSNDDRMEV